jgi:hypothetical protein
VLACFCALQSQHSYLAWECSWQHFVMRMRAKACLPLPQAFTCAKSVERRYGQALCQLSKQSTAILPLHVDGCAVIHNIRKLNLPKCFLPLQVLLSLCVGT